MIQVGPDFIVSLWSDDGEDNRIDWALKDWQVVDIQLPEFSAGDPPSITFNGRSTGTLYLDDIHLLVASGGNTAVVENQVGSAPLAFALSQNFPNPFNSDTTIRVDLPAATSVELSLHTLTGQRVATLARGVRGAGSYTFRWDGRNDSGQEMATGVYYYRLTARERVQTRKLLLLR